MSGRSLGNLRMLPNRLLLLSNIVITATKGTLQHRCKANLIVDLLHPLEVGLGNTLRAEDSVLESG